MLEADDRELLNRFVAFVSWQRQPVEKTNQEIIDQYNAVMALIENPIIADMINIRMDVRTIIAALRRKDKGLAQPKTGEPWGVGRLVRHIEKNWDDADFKLSSSYPWISRARELITNGESVELEKLLMNIIWHSSEKLSEQKNFGFEKVLSYLFRWDILQRWLEYDVEKAKIRIDELTNEALTEQGELFTND